MIGGDAPPARLPQSMPPVGEADLGARGPEAAEDGPMTPGGGGVAAEEAVEAADEDGEEARTPSCGPQPAPAYQSRVGGPPGHPSPRPELVPVLRGGAV